MVVNVKNRGREKTYTRGGGSDQKHEADGYAMRDLLGTKSYSFRGRSKHQDKENGSPVCSAGLDGKKRDPRRTGSETAGPYL